MPQATIHVQICDGSRQPMAASNDILLTVRPQFSSKPLFAEFVKGNSFNLAVDVPGDGSGFAVLASTKGYEQAGLAPVKVAPGKTTEVPLMLLSRMASYQFGAARFDRLNPLSAFFKMLMGTEPDPDRTRARYTDLLESQPDSLACLLNIVSAFDELPVADPANGFNSPLEYLKSIQWGPGVRRDRFFGQASESLIAAVRKAASQGHFEEEKGAAIFHPGAAESYKQTEFDEANVQVTFHEKSTTASGEKLVRFELDMDYFKDLAAHALLEVIPNTFSGGKRKTDARQIYVMRWMAGKAKGKDFAPPYTVA